MATVGDDVKKTILHAGKYLPTFEHGTKVTFHFQCNVLHPDGEVGPLLDDSRKSGRPMELIIGKQFKLEAWEECLKSMHIDEVCQLDVNKSYALTYPVVSKTYRQFAGISKSESKAPCCGMAALKDTMGESDLDALIRNPKDLRFIFELLKVEQPGEYEKESWSMTPEEKLVSVPQLKEDGNNLYKCKKYKEASEKYAEALNRLEQLMLREKPEDEEWLELEKMKQPLLLNYSQCKLLDQDYYPVIEYTSQVLQRDPDNVKALYRRAKAHAGVWDIESAQNDYMRILELDDSLKNVIQKELANLSDLQKQRDNEDKNKYFGKLF